MFTIIGNRVYAGYGVGQPLLTGEGCSIGALAAAAVLYASR
jgi:hypothetical protein